MYPNRIAIFFLHLIFFWNLTQAAPKIFLLNHPNTANIPLDANRLVQLTAQSQSVSAATGESFEFVEDFEGQFPGGNWSVYDFDGEINGEYFWGKTSQRKFSGQSSAWCAAGGADGFDPENGDYPAFCNSAMTWGPMDLTTAASCKFYLRFWLESDAAMNYDGIYWGATKGDSILLKNYSGSSGGWVHDSLDVHDLEGVNWLGSKEVYLIVLFLSDPEISAEGAYVDDVRISVLETTPPGFTDIQANLTSMKNGSAAWGDYNNDSRLDLLLTGTKDNAYYAQIYENQQNGDFVDIRAGLAPLAGGNSGWADFNNDGYLDILHSGYDGSQNILKIYLNQSGAGFADARAGLTPRDEMFAHYADFNNDGALDVVVTGSAGSLPVTDFYRNNRSGEFESVPATLETNLTNGTIITGDYDNDGDLDLLVTGQSGSRAQTLLYRNDGEFSFTEINTHFEGLTKASGAFGDYDNDGDLDLLLSGRDVAENAYTLLYRNNGNDNFSKFQDNFFQSKDGTAAWGDYNNDGVLDILLSGYNSRRDYVQIYQNKGSDYFTRIDDELPDVFGPCAWADFDNDDDLDLLISGWNGSRSYETAIFRNNSTVANRRPHAPGELLSEIVQNSALLTWSGASDDATPVAGLSYNLYIGKAIRRDEMLPSHAHNNSGLRKIVATGNCQKMTYWQINNLPAGDYFWSVQAIDAAFAGSRFPADQAFTIVGTELVLLSPNGGEFWEGDSVKTIRWNLTSLAQIRLDYSTDDGQTWEKITEAVPASPPNFSWRVPKNPSATCLVRVSDVSNAERLDVSDQSFTIFLPTLSLVAPTGGEKWCAGSRQTIAWQATHVQEIDLFYSVNQGETWPVLAANFNAALGTFAWEIPAVSSAQCLVKIVDSANPLRFDASDSAFSIYPASVQVQSPNGGEFWRVDRTELITWETQNIQFLKIEYSFDSTQTWRLIDARFPTESAQFEWQIPKTQSSQCFIRLTDTENAHVSDVSDAAFSIYLPFLNLTRPVGGEIWRAGTVQPITWNSRNIDHVKLDFSANGTDWNSISASYPAASGEFAWEIPVISSPDCFVRISSVSEPEITGSNADPFSIQNPTVTLTAPNGGEQIFTGTTFQIRWQATDLQAIKLEFFGDNLKTWVTIADSVAADAEKFTWQIPDFPAENCQVRISDSQNATIYDVSDSTFVMLQPQILLVAPNGLETWCADSTYQIIWRTNGIESLKIEFSADSGHSWQAIADTVAAGAGEFSWQPVRVGDSCLVRICDLENPALCDQSDRGFSIYQPVLQLISPNGNEKWEVGRVQEISWRAEHIDSVQILFSANNGADWDPLATTMAAPGSCLWTIPNRVSAVCLVKIIDFANPKYWDSSDATFLIFETIQSVNPGAAPAPTEFALEQNYPNPFNPTTQIRFALPQTSRVVLRVFDFQGREIKTLMHGEKPAGVYAATFDARQLPSGVYFYQLNTPHFSATRKMLLVK
jgi:hypothetical protein